MFEVIISFMVLAITFNCIGPILTEKLNSETLQRIAAVYGVFGIFLVGTGMYIGGGMSLKAYYYITFLIELITLCISILIYRLIKKRGHSKLINVCLFSLLTISYGFYIYFIVASFIYY